MRLFYEIAFKVVSAILMLILWRWSLELLIQSNLLFLFVMFLALIFTFKTFE